MRENSLILSILALAALMALPASAEENPSRGDIEAGTGRAAIVAEQASGAAVEAAEVLTDDAAPGEMADVAAPDPFADAVKQALDKSDAPEPYVEAVTVFYEDRGYEPLWADEDGLTDKAREAISFIGEADAWGLDPADYDTPYANLGEGARVGPAALARAEVALTMAALRYAGDAQGGRVLPPQVGNFITAQPEWPEAEAVLEALAGAGDVAGTLEDYHPQQPGFEQLRKALAELRRAEPAASQVAIAEGATLKPGMRDIRVPDLRRRLGLDAVDGEAGERYDEELRAAVEEFQERSGLEVDGIIGNQTLIALNAALEATPADVIANMERWRWLPRDLGKHHVRVNIPEFRLWVVTDGEPVFETRVIVGTRENQTPLFSDEIEYVDVNPYWNVPRSIAVKEMLPAAQRDPSYLVRQGIEVLYEQGGRTHVIDPRAIDWRMWTADTMPFRFRQPPGEANALGRVKFMFPNQHAVYLHDTPTRHLFARSNRALSHGCVRVEDPVAFADALLAFEEEINGERIKRLIGGQNGSLQMKRHVPVHLSYFTLWVDEDGELQRRPDIYGHDARLKTALGLDRQTRAAGLAIDGKVVP